MLLDPGRVGSVERPQAESHKLLFGGMRGRRGHRFVSSGLDV
jgi:hypothetical protein